MLHMRKLASGTWTSLFLAAVSIIASDAAYAQSRLELTPFFSSYYALSSLREGDALAPQVIKQAPAAGAGISLGGYFSRAVGLEVSATYQSGRNVLITPDAVDPASLPSLGANVLLLSARALFKVERRSNFELLLGGGVVRRSGSLWSERIPQADKLTSASLVVGARVRAAVTPRLPLRVGLEAHLSKPDFDGPSNNFFESRTQADVSVSVGIPIGLSGSR